MNKTSKRALSFIMTMVITLGTLMGSLSVPVNALDLNEKYEVSWDYILTDENNQPFVWYGGISSSSNEYGHSYPDGAHKIHDYTVKKVGLGDDKSQWIYNKDYLYCFCIEPGVSLPNKYEYIGSDGKTHGDKWERMSESQRNLIMLALTYGYPNRTDLETSKDANAAYSCTQVIVWMASLNWLTMSGSTITINDKSYPSSGYSGGMVEQLCKNKSFKHYFDLIINDMENHYTRPSFVSAFQSSAPVYELTKSGEQYTLQLIDTNNVLSDFYVTSSNGVSANISGNILTLTSNTPITSDTTITMRRRLPTTGHTSGFLLWSVPGHESENQDMVSGVDSDPVPAYLKLQVNTGDMKIVKTSEDNIVANISFTISGNGINQTVKTLSNGEIVIPGLQEGTYTVTESSIDRYKPQESKTVIVVSGGISTVTFNNTLKRGSVEVIKSSEDNYNEGHKFRLYGTSLSGLPVDQYAVTDSSGKAVFNDVLISGSAPYVIEEVDTQIKYIVPEKQNVSVNWNEVTTKKFNNILKKGTVEVIKSSEDNYNEGHKFRLYGTSLSGLPVDQYAVTDSSGKAVFNDVLISGSTSYIIEEVDTQIRYVVPEKQNVTVKWNEVTRTTTTNKLKKFNVELLKVDSYTGTSTSRGDGSTVGAVYGIYNDGVLIDTYTTDKNSSFTTKYYSCGDNWTLKEITPSEGHLLDTTEYHIGAEAKLYTVEYNTVKMGVEEDSVLGKFSITKHTDDGQTQIETPEENAIFEVFLLSAGSYSAAKPDERDILTTNKNGYAESKSLPYGWYKVTQTASGVPGKEKVAPFIVYISEHNIIKRYIINNADIEAKLRVEKRDSETDKLIMTEGGYEGIGFKIKDPNGNFITQHIDYPTPLDLDTFYVNTEGWLMLPQKIPYGIGYQLIEVQTGYGYVLSNEPVLFDVTGDDTTVTVVKYNKPQKGIISIFKEGEVFYTVTETNGIYTPHYEIQKVGGAIYKIYANENIYLNGDLKVKKDTLVDIVSVSDNGGSSTPLYLGQYRIEEEKSPYSFILNPNPQYVTLSYAGQTVELTSADIAFFNERQKVVIDLNKVMEQDELFEIGNNNEILSVSMGLYADEDIIAKDGTKIPKDGLIEIVNVSENGYAVFTSDIPVDSKLYVKEISTDNHFVLSENKFLVVFEYEDQNTALVNLHANKGSSIENKIKRGDVEGLKLDEDGSVLAGALIGLFTTNTTEYTEENALLTDISLEDGTFGFENVPYGEWVCREIATPGPQYVLDDTVYPVTISADKQIIEINITNIFVRGDVEGMKLDENGEALAGALIGLFNPDETEFTADNAVMTDISKEDGSFSFTEVIFGDWIVREIAQPSAAYVLNEALFPVTIAENKEIINIEIENLYVRGSVRITKVDAEYPDNKLTGAIFDVFADTDGNKEFDEDIDLLIGTLDEIEDGIYQLDGLVYSGYFLKERTAPDLFLLDENTYYFEILTNGEIVEVENQAGIGFKNKPAYGELWLTKKDVSTGELIENCGIRIKDMEGNTILEDYTDENGEVKFSLRAGKYTYSEFSCDGYILDESEYLFEILENGQIIKAEMTNEKILIPENPQTGDSSPMLLYFIIMLISASTFIFILVSKGKRFKRTVK